MNQGEVIRSMTGTLQLKDQFHWALLGGAAWKCALLLPSVSFLILISIFVLSGQPMTRQAVFIETVFPSLVILIMLAVWTIFFVVMGYRRLTKSQLTNTWTFSQKGVAVEDEAGNQVLRPWSQVAFVEYSVKGVRVICKPMGSLWVPERFLEANDLKRLQNLTKTLKLSAL